MAPKVAKKKKKTKEELEEERRLAEEAARLAEEERKRLEEEERKRLEELERQRQELLTTLLGIENERCAAEMQEMEPLLVQCAHERAKAAEQRRQDWEWERYLSCSHVPHPLDTIGLSDFKTATSERKDVVLSEALAVCEDCFHLTGECILFQQKAHLEGNAQASAMHLKDVEDVHQLINQVSDRVSAHILHFADEHANDKGEVQTGLKQGSFQLAVWVNTSKNPRMKTVEMPQLNMVVDIPKQIALASVAMRVQHRACDEFYRRCTNEYMAVGGVLYADLLTLPPPAKKVKHWTLRQVTHLSSNVQRIPYPIPPAGADPATYRAEEEPPPLGFTFPFTPNIVLLDDPIKVGWWDPDTSAWRSEGVSGTLVDPETGHLTFQSTHMGPLAVIQSRCRLYPYQSWSVRPTGGKGGDTAAVTLEVGLAEPLVFEAGPGWVQLATPAAETWPQLAGVAGRKMQPSALLLELSTHGIHLLPDDRDADPAGVKVKVREAEEALCSDLGLLCGAFLMAKAKWNQTAASEECIARISEVLDWEEGGRTEYSHVLRVFSKEKEDGERRVLAVVRRGSRGFAFCDALDKRPALPALPGHESVESVKACMETVWGEVHAGLLTLLKGPSLKNEELEAGPLLHRLKATQDGLELASNTNPLLSQVVGQLLYLLRVFSFS
ncbi:hypothetical protein CEUSTIGMA_g8793.t1 [Chlamydomonas eustigma]|uniref:IC97/Casc1 N-terminal domain-containing protein n=1 Tax=Chlamydomonas eustigma TaxID=1157962 RepID=A0A250XEL9_9CHLO|nr:hypothetical protein CEUSTIGMA_g8793.t1 [Chlamydomonas eustigma]|eukprot:GAX81362.1 hypothetical protein CEUSTIGMA_g8793.t1 [Chlamydomonas eustigma]